MYTMIEEVILVNDNDEEISTMEKIEAHKKGMLHRAFSIFIFNSKSELLIHKRAMGKYHSEGLWTNTCCSHPRPGEDLIKAANRRLMEEMGLSCKLQPAFSFVYKIVFPSGLIEHELDHVIIGASEEKPVINKNEVSEWKYISLEELRKDTENTPEKYTQWFMMCYEKAFANFNDYKIK